MPPEEKDEEWRSEIDEDVLKVEENREQKGAEIEIVLRTPR